jgi:hypothetical protein
MVPEAEAIGSSLCWLLQKLEMEELIFAAPRQAGRILRPLCRMLGVEPPSALQLPRPVRVRRVEETSEPEPPPEPVWQEPEPDPPSETPEEAWNAHPPRPPPKLE